MANLKKMGRIGWWAILPLAAVTIVFGAGRIAALWADVQVGHTPSNLFDRRYVTNPWMTVLHIAAGSLFFVLGPFQFIRDVRRKWLWAHRLAGRIFLFAGTLVGVSAIVMALRFPAFGGLPTSSATLFFGVFFLVALAKALYHVRRKEIGLHRQWMIRAFAIGLAVSTIRIYIILFQIFSHYSFEDVFGVTFWLAFCTHALVAEWWIRSTRPAG